MLYVVVLGRWGRQKPSVEIYSKIDQKRLFLNSRNENWYFILLGNNASLKFFHDKTFFPLNWKTKYSRRVLPEKSSGRVWRTYQNPNYPICDHNLLFSLHYIDTLSSTQVIRIDTVYKIIHFFNIVLVCHPILWSNIQIMSWQSVRRVNILSLGLNHNCLVICITICVLLFQLYWSL